MAEAKNEKWPFGLRAAQVELALKLATINEKVGQQVISRGEIRKVLGLHV